MNVKVVTQSQPSTVITGAMVGSIATTTPQMSNGSVPQQQGVSKYLRLIDLMTLEDA